MLAKNKTKKQLDKWLKLKVEPSIEASIDHAVKVIRQGNATDFIQTTMSVNRTIDTHLARRCSDAENEETRIDCVAKAEDVRDNAINKLSEILAEKCDLKVEYVEEDLFY